MPPETAQPTGDANVAADSTTVEPAAAPLATPSATTEHLADSKRDKDMAGLQTCILRHWIHSHEEDTQELTVYRPAGYNFPPSRGRMGLEFKSGGELIYYGIARADGSEPASGSWKLESNNQIQIKVNNARITPFVVVVVTCDDQTLKTLPAKK